MEFISGVINPSNDLTKPLGWVLHDRHAHRIMGTTNLCLFLLFALLKTSTCVRSITNFLGNSILFWPFCPFSYLLSHPH